MPYKYDAEIQALADCPPVAHTQKTLVAFRYVWTDDRHPKSFLPVQKLKPNRKFKDAKELCENYALSLYDTDANARAFYVEFSTGHDAAKLLGTHLASVPIDVTDGVISDPDETGHMDLHESDVADLASKCTVVGALP